VQKIVCSKNHKQGIVTPFQPSFITQGQGKVKTEEEVEVHRIPGVRGRPRKSPNIPHDGTIFGATMEKASNFMFDLV
jgi:hypothetical protein